jgi:hypothetical protein
LPADPANAAPSGALLIDGPDSSDGVPAPASLCTCSHVNECALSPKLQPIEAMGRYLSNPTPALPRLEVPYVAPRDAPRQAPANPSLKGWTGVSASPDRTLDRIAAGGLLVGAVFGLAGTLVASPTLQASLWAIDSVALVVATSLLALRYFRAGVDALAAGFLVFAIGEGVLLSGTAAGPAASVPAFAAGTALWAAALILISAPPRLPWWLRMLGGSAAGLFAITAGSIYAGAALLPTSSPLPFVAYPFLVATLLGWAWVLLRAKA